MTTTYDGAYNSITAALKTYWAANAGTLITPVPEIRFYGNELTTIPTTYFIRFAMHQVMNRQSSFRQTDGKRFREDGIVSIEVYAPRSDRQAYQKMRQLSMLLQRRFRSAIDCISFNNVRINDVASEENFWRQNVIAEYRFDELQG